MEEHTFAINPQERASRLPFTKHTASEEPLASSSVVKVVSDVVIRRWIWGKYPFSEALSRLIPCKHVKGGTARTTRWIANNLCRLRRLPIAGPLASFLFRLINVYAFKFSIRVAIMLGVPFMMMWVSFRISAAAIRASSWVNLSNRLRASSKSFFPTSFFRYFSEHRLADNYISLRATHSLDPAPSPLLRSRRCSALRPLSSRLYRSLRPLVALRCKTQGA